MYLFFIPPLLGAFIGYLTNVVAVKLLFHPKKPIRILGFRIQGLIPAKSEEFAHRIIDVFEEYVGREEFRELIEEAIEKTIRESRLFRILSNSAVIAILERYGVVDRISDQIEDLLSKTQVMASKVIVENIDFRKFLERKIAEFSEEEAEYVFKKLAKNEMRFIEISGAILGFLIGLVQSIFFIIAH
ncbi:DUF445 family protein [Geoglobus acetivorans]|nr:DUF445 family protein [Geoglobus acetivorans]